MELSTVNRGSALWTVKKSIEAPPTGEEQHSNTLIGEELYAASAYLKGDPMQLGTLKGQDYYKFLILSFILLGTALASFHITAVTRLFPTK